MVATLKSYTDAANHALPGTGYDGVVRVSTSEAYGTGALLYGGRTVLTAAHLLYGANARDVTVYFETDDESRAVGASWITLHPDYEPFYSNGDLALVWLSGAAPAGAERYDVYRSMDEQGKQFTMAGYGAPGTGEAGVDRQYDGEPLRLKATNRFDADAASIEKALNGVNFWNPAAGTQFAADFDNGHHRYDALGFLLDLADTGTVSEGMVTSGDSGGPAFIDGRIAGVASYIGIYDEHDYDAIPFNSSFGELGFWQRAGYYQQWIDQSLRERYPEAPEYRHEVERSVTEGDEGTTYTYFMLEFTGERSDPDEWLSVDYATQDGTALAGEDYVPVSGTLVLYPGEIQAVIPVEIIGDILPEQEEQFSLVVTNPVGGSFGEGVDELAAVRTIVDNDAQVWW